MASKDFAVVVAELKHQGWEVDRTAQGRIRARSPEKDQGVIHFTESGDWRAIRNTVSTLKKMGFRWPPSQIPKRAAAAKDPAEAIPPPPVSGVRQVDSKERLRTELEEAAAYYALAEEHLDECVRKADEATKACEVAEEEVDGAATRLREARRRLREAETEEDQELAETG